MIGKIQNYKELIAYQKSYAIVLLVYKITEGFPKEEMYGLTSQMRRAAVSIPSNIAEGYMRGTKEYVQFLKIGLGSCAELETQLLLSADIKFVEQKALKPVLDLITEVMKLLTTYINRIQN